MALPEQYLHILKTKLQAEFVPYLPELLGKDRPKADQDKKQLSRAFSGFALHKLLGIGIASAAKAVVDDFDDNGIDAIFYLPADKTLYLVQTKLQEGKQFDELDAIRFRSGVDLLLSQRFERFNVNVRNRSEELENAFNEADKIQLVVAYIGDGITAHALAALRVLTEDKEHHEAVRLVPNIIEFDPQRIQTELLAEQSMGVVNDYLSLTKWQHLGGVRDTHIGIAKVADLVALHAAHKKALYERNIRYYLGSKDSTVNRSIQETLRNAPQEFFFLNNGVTVLADIVETRGTKVDRRLFLRGFSVINGAQTISSAAEFVAANSACDISEARVLVTIIRTGSEGAFGQSVTRARNHQNPVSTGNFASLDPKQEELRRELAYLGFSYHYRPEALPRNPDATAGIITIEQAMKSLALFNPDPRYAFWLKNEVARFQNAESVEYKSLFSESLAGVQTANRVRFYRFVRDVLAASSGSTKGSERLFYKHGAFVVASVLAKMLRNRMGLLELSDHKQLNEILSAPLDKCRQLCWENAAPLIGQGRSVLAFFQSQGETVRLIELCMASLYGLSGTEAYASLRTTVDRHEAFPREKLFRYLSSQAPQV